MVYKWCVVPQCTNTSINTPHKLFVSVPTNPKKRKMWLELAQRDPKSIVAHSNVFMCEDHFNMDKDTTNLMQYKMGFSQKLLLSDDAMPTKFQCQDNSKRLTNAVPRGLHKKQKVVPIPTESNPESFQYNVEIKQEVIEPEESPSQDKKTVITQEKSVQVTLKANNHFGSKTAHTNHQTFEERKSDDDISSFKSDHSSPFVSTSSTKNIDFNTNKDIENLQMLKNSMSLIDKEPFVHVGISKECYSLIIELLHKHTNIKIEQILLCLTKIRLNSTFSELTDHFGISMPDASAIFLSNIPILSSYLRKFIINLHKNLFNDSCVIDCLEIDIEAPSETLYQEMTWSEYKKCHTMKYLISCTPNGLVNYVSQGFGGRTKDVTIVENCNFLEELQKGTCILADRGFKHIEKVFHEKGMKILRPPSVNSEGKLSETEVRLTKIIASLRIHIEKVFMGIREFSMLKQNSMTDTSISCVLDDVIIIACALVNLQDSPIK